MSETAIKAIDAKVNPKSDYAGLWNKGARKDLVGGLSDFERPIGDVYGIGDETVGQLPKGATAAQLAMCPLEEIQNICPKRAEKIADIQEVLREELVYPNLTILNKDQRPTTVADLMQLPITAIKGIGEAAKETFVGEQAPDGDDESVSIADLYYAPPEVLEEEAPLLFHKQQELHKQLHAFGVRLPPHSKPPPEYVEVVRVIDGDTVVLSDGYQEWNVRLVGVNTTELHGNEAMSLEALAFVEKWVKKHPVVQTKDVGCDKYGRRLIVIENNDLSEALLKNGMAHIFLVGDDNEALAKDMDRLVAAQEHARKKGIGIWSLPRFQHETVVTSFHANGLGNDVSNPCVEYFRLANISNKTINLEGYQVQLPDGKTITLPSFELEPGRSVRISSGEGTNSKSNLYLGSDKPLYNNASSSVWVSDKQGKPICETRIHERKNNPNLKERLNSREVSQLYLGRRLSADETVIYHGPKEIIIDLDKFNPELDTEDGDSGFLDVSMLQGLFTATVISEKDGEKEEIATNIPVHIAPTPDAPEDPEAIGKGIDKAGWRIMRMDTWETSVKAKIPLLGKKTTEIKVGQGRLGHIATKRFRELVNPANLSAMKFIPAYPRAFDKYGRLLVDIQVKPKKGSDLKIPSDMVDKKGWVDVSRIMLAEGLAIMYMYYNHETFDLDRFNESSAACEYACNNRLGIWENYDKDNPSKGMFEEPGLFRYRVQHRASVSLGVDVANLQEGVIGANGQDVAPWHRLLVPFDQRKHAIKELGLVEAKDMDATKEPETVQTDASGSNPQELLAALGKARAKTRV